MAVWSFWICPPGFADISLISICHSFALYIFQVFLFIFGCPGISLLSAGFLQLQWAGAARYDVRASPCGSFSCCGSYALGLVGFSNCSTWNSGVPACGIFPDQGETCVPCGPLDHLALLFLEIFSPPQLYVLILLLNIFTFAITFLVPAKIILVLCFSFI